MVHKITEPIADWVWSGTREVNVFYCPRCFGEVCTITTTPKYCTWCGLKFSNGNIEMEE